MSHPRPHPHPLQSPFKPQPSLIFSCKPHFRVFKRHRLKPTPPAALPFRCLQNPFQSQFENLLHSVTSQFDYDKLLPSALAFASGAALSLSQRFTSKGGPNSQPCDVGEWILFSSPTPFNRFVLLRCPSISFEGSELLEDVNERLVKEDRHFVRFNTGRMHVNITEADAGASASEPKLEYQRLCIGADDGGVISLDWPANLDLKEEKGLDSTLLLVPGTTEGSMDQDVKAFVLEALKRGFFPVVMNPRGCAGSPLTTARLFTAADSDDISTAIHFIGKARTWTTMMGVGWGFGANMLTKYLAEVGEKTPLTAATCINNPFDLEEATRSFPYQNAIDEKLTAGLKDILRANKVLFQGKTKRFDVDEALSAKSIRDFEKAISMVSYEFEAVEEFYSRSSTRDLIGNIKVPLLFIQNDDGTVPLFSVPRGKIAENPYTSLLLCSSMPSGKTGKISVLSWCQHLTVEWLAGVELGLLKGRHPLLKDVDISINPSKGLSLVDANASNQTTKIKKLLELKEANVYSMDRMNGVLEDNDIIGNQIFGSMLDPQKQLEEVNKEIRGVENGGLQQSNAVDTELVKGEENSSMDTESGQVLQSAKVIMNMLDITMPGVLTEDKKWKVLNAMSQGETLMKALQDAVPEDVRGKITDAVSGILHAQRADLMLNKIQETGRIPNTSPTLKSKSEEGVIDTFDVDAPSKGNEPSCQKPRVENSALEDGSYGEHQLQHSSKLEAELPCTGSTSSREEETKISTGESGNSFEFEEFSRQGSSDSAPPTSAEISKELKEKSADDTSTDSMVKEGLDSEKSEETSDSPSEEKNASSNVTEDIQSSSQLSSEVPLAEKDKNDDQKKEIKSIPSAPSSNTPSFSVTEALDALTGMDDSTQVAVNSVFGVLEEMITHLEEGSGDENGDGDDVDDKEVDEPLQKHERTHSDAIKMQEAIKQGSGSDSQLNASNGFDVEKLAQSSERQGDHNRLEREENIGNTYLVNSKALDSNDIDKLRLVNGIPFYATAKPYGWLLQDKQIRSYLFSKIPTKSLDMDTTAALLLDYIPEEGQWKLHEQPGNNGDSIDSVATNVTGANRTNRDQSSTTLDLIDKFTETPYFMMGTGEYAIKDQIKKQGKLNGVGSSQLVQFIKMIILDTLKVEVDRRMNEEDKKEMEPSLAVDCELVADAVCSAVRGGKELTLDLKSRTYSTDNSYEKIGTLDGEIIVGALSSTVLETNSLKRILPVGVVVGSCLAALREFFDVVTAQCNVKIGRDITDGETNGMNIFGKSAMKEMVLAEKSPNNSLVELNEKEIDPPPDEGSDIDSSDYLLLSGENNGESKEKCSRQVMVGVVTAALGTSALLAKQHVEEMREGSESVEISSKSFKEEEKHKELGDVSSEKDQTNLVTSLAEKAMSVAAPVVPTKEDGEVDQERLVAILAELGQRGGLLKLVGKVALLWGGLRGAMSFTDKLISFLRIAERPLVQRIVAFMCMVLVLWSPILVPLLPTLVQSWMSHRTSKIAELACIAGLYAAVIILVMLWGRRIRGYEEPFRQYGLDLTSLHKVHDLLKGFVAGVMLIMAIQILNSQIGCTSFCWPPGLPTPSVDALAKLKAYAKILLLAGRGILAAIGISIVEELLFRSWLPEEIATDLGYHWGIILSGLAFSLLQRPLWALPGLWLFSLSLSGIRHRNDGSISIPIGLHAGIIASNYILQTGGFLSGPPNVPVWILGTHPFQPFSGIVGFIFSLAMAAILYPSEQIMKKRKLKRTIRE